MLKLIAKVIRYPGGYLRFSGPVSLDPYQGGELVEHYEETASFELCYLARDIYGDQ